MGNLWHQRVIWIRICQQRADRQQHLRHSHHRLEESLQCSSELSISLSMSFCKRSKTSKYGTCGINRQGRPTLLTVSAGLHCSLRMSKQMLPLLFTFGW